MEEVRLTLGGAPCQRAVDCSLGQSHGRTLGCKHSEKGTSSGRIAKPRNSKVQSYQIQL